MMKAYPRVWVDLTTAEVCSALLRMIHPSRARGRSRIARFEGAFSEFVGTKGAVAFPNCRSALYFSLKALNLKEGDEVILPAFTFWADAAVTVLNGLKPVFVDVDSQTMNIDPAQIEKVLTARTRAIIPVHLNGLPADMGPIMDIARRHHLRVIEDCARACGSRYQGRRVGSFDIGAFSFGYGKSFYGFGGGMVTSEDGELIRRLRDLKRNFKTISIKNLYQATLKGCLLKLLNTPAIHGYTLFPMAYRYQVNGDQRFSSWFQIKKPHLEGIPEAFRIDMYDLQARLGFRQIRTIDQTNMKRRENLRLLNRELSGLDSLQIPATPGDREHVCVHYAVWTPRKKALQDFLLENRIDAQDESAEDVTQMERFRSFANGGFPNARRLHKQIIYIPTHPCLGKEDLLYIAEKIKAFFRNGSR